MSIQRHKYTEQSSDTKRWLASPADFSLRRKYYFGAKSSNGEDFIILSELLLSKKDLYQLSALNYSIPSLKIKRNNDKIVFDRLITLKNIYRRIKKYPSRNKIRIFNIKTLVPIKIGNEVLTFTSFQFYSPNFKAITLLNPLKMEINYKITDKEDHINLIVVLGNTDPIIRAKRINRAIELFNQMEHRLINDELGLNRIITYILFSGGCSNNEFELSEAELMKEYALTKGLKEDFILLETKSLNTIQNIKFTYNYIEKTFPMIDYPHTYHFITSNSHKNRVKFIVNHLYPNIDSYFHKTNEKVSNKQKEIEDILIYKLKKQWNS